MSFGAIVMALSSCTPTVSAPPATATPPASPPSASVPAQPTSVPTTGPSFAQTDVPTGPCGDAIAAPASTGGAAKAQAVFTDGGTVAVYDIAADAVASIGEAAISSGRGPMFRAPGLLAFARGRLSPDDGRPLGQDSIFELDLGTGAEIEVLRLPSSVLGYDWSPDGTLLAYQLRSDTATEIGPRLLCLLDSVGGRTSLLRSIERPFGTGTGQREETAVTWSPSGRFILAVETAAQPSLFVVDTAGRDVVAPRDGTFGRWLADDRLIFQKDPHTDRVQPWVSLSTSTDREREFGLPERAYRPVLSPVGGVIAFDDGDAEEASLYIFEIEQETTRRLVRGFVAPIWLDRDSVAAIGTGPSTLVGGIPWSVMPGTTRIDMAGEKHDLTLTTTLQDDVRYGVIDTIFP